MKKHPISALVFDYDFYPRGSVDTHHVNEIEGAIEAGMSIPPVVIDRASKRVVDGFHRCRAYTRLYGENYEVECVEKTYADDAALFIDAIRYNASHGRALTQHDKVHCLLLADKYHLDDKKVGEALGLTSTRVGELRSTRVGTLSSVPIPLKRTMQHLAGRELTPAQVKANEKSSGMNALFYVNQLISLLDSDSLDSTDGNLKDGLYQLQASIKRWVTEEEAA